MKGMKALPVSAKPVFWVRVWARALFVILLSLPTPSHAVPLPAHELPQVPELKTKDRGQEAEDELNSSGNLEAEEEKNKAIPTTELSKCLKDANAALSAGDSQRALKILKFAASKYTHNFEPYLGIARVYYVEGKAELGLQLLASLQEKFPLYPELYAMRGNLYLSLGRLSDAQAAYKTAVQLDPDDSDSCYILARISLSLFERDDEAISWLRLSLQSQAQNLSARVLLARLLWKNGELKDALLEMTSARGLDPDNPQLICEEAALLAERGRTLEALERLLQAYKLSPDSAEIQKQILTIYGIRQDWASALDAATAWVQLEPKNPKALLALAWTMLRNHEFDDASQPLKTALALAPEDAELHNVYGLLLCERRKPEEAIQQFKSAGSEHLPALLNLAALNIFRLHYNEALNDLEFLEANFPDLPGVFSLRAYLEAKSGKTKKAELYIQKALGIDSRDPLAFISKGIVLRIQGKLPESIDTLKEAVKLDKQSPLALCELSDSYLANGQCRDSIESAQQALQLAPQNTEAKAVLASALSREGNYDGAILLLKECVSRNPKDLPLRMFLAELQMKKGEIYLAKNTLNKVRSLFPEKAEPLIALAEIALEENELNECRDLLQEALQYAPGHRKILTLKARNYLASGKTALALDQFATMADLKLDGEELALRARCHFANNDLKAAIADYNKAITLGRELAPQDLLNLARCHISSGDNRAAEQTIEKLKTMSETSRPLQTQLLKLQSRLEVQMRKSGSKAPSKLSQSRKTK